MEKERNKDFAERHHEQPTLEPQTLAQHFKEGAINMAKDFRGT